MTKNFTWKVINYYFPWISLVKRYLLTLEIESIIKESLANLDFPFHIISSPYQDIFTFLWWFSCSVRQIYSKQLSVQSENSRLNNLRAIICIYTKSFFSLWVNESKRKLVSLIFCVIIRLNLNVWNLTETG